MLIVPDSAKGAGEAAKTQVSIRRTFFNRPSTTQTRSSKIQEVGKEVPTTLMSFQELPRFSQVPEGGSAQDSSEVGSGLHLCPSHRGYHYGLPESGRMTWCGNTCTSPSHCGCQFVRRPGPSFGTFIRMEAGEGNLQRQSGGRESRTACQEPLCCCQES